jgi:hypothetical protein
MALSDSDVERIKRMLILIKENLEIATKLYAELAPAWLEWKPSSVDWNVVELAFVSSENMLKDPEMREAIYIALANHGLVGTQLESKMALLKSGTGRVQEYRKRFSPKIPRAVSSRLISWLLDLLDDFMDSLSAAFPPLGAATEFKKAIETGLNAPQELQ